jgi:hypothetical protein
MTTSKGNPKVEAILHSIQSSYNALNHLLEGPLSHLDKKRLYEKPIPDEWSLMENIAHINEILPYWAGEIEKLVAHPGQNFGRTQQHAGRLQAIAVHGTDTLAKAQAELPGGYARLEGVIRTLKDSDLELTGIHPRFGECQLGWFIEEFVTRHLANHLLQMQAILLAFEAQ